MKKEVGCYIDEGIIRQCSKSPYNFPAFAVKRQTGKLRIVSDMRELRKKTVSNWLPVPDLKEILYALKVKKYFHMPDFKSAFCSIGLSENSKKKNSINMQF